jgi:TatD-related deoxyribonuclease
MDKVPVYDNHFHMSPAGRNVDALLEFQAAGGTGITLVTLPYAEVPITKGSDFEESFKITYDLARKARERTDVEINVAVGPYPVLIIPLSEKYGLEAAEEMLMQGMEDAAKDIAEGKACAIGEVGRPHFPTEQRYVDAANRVLQRGMELGKELDVPLIIHCESEDHTDRSLSEMARKVGLDPGMVIKHSSPPLVTEEETFGVMPSMPASKSNIKTALGKGTTRFMIETDYIDDPAKPTSIMAPATVPNKVRQMLGSGMADEEVVCRICKDIPDSLYHR